MAKSTPPPPLPPDLAVLLEELLKIKQEKWFGKVTIWMEGGTAFRYEKSENVMVKDKLARKVSSTE